MSEKLIPKEYLPPDKEQVEDKTQEEVTFKDFPHLLDEEEQAVKERLGQKDYPLFRQLRYGTTEERLRAVEQLMIRHRKLVPRFITILQNERRIYTTTALSEEDYIQAGYIGLSKALRRFDYAKGTRFSTYAFWWVMDAATHELKDYGLLVRVPVNKWGEGNRVGKKKAELTGASGHEPTDEEIAEAMEKTTTPRAVGQATRAKQIINRAEHRLSIDNRRLVSGDMSPDERQFMAQRDIVDTPDVGTAALIEAFERHPPKVRQALLQFIRGNVIPRVAGLLIDRFGLENPGGKGMTLKEVGQKMSITRERVRQLETKGLEALRRRLDVLDRHGVDTIPEETKETRIIRQALAEELEKRKREIEADR